MVLVVLILIVFLLWPYKPFRDYVTKVIYDIVHIATKAVDDARKK
jgi:hypothetical protein